MSDVKLLALITVPSMVSFVSGEPAAREDKLCDIIAITDEPSNMAFIGEQPWKPYHLGYYVYGHGDLRNILLLVRALGYKWQGEIKTVENAGGFRHFFYKDYCKDIVSTAELVTTRPTTNEGTVIPSRGTE